MQITRTTNPNGTYRYEIDGELHTKASKVLYTHVSVWTVGGVGRDFVTFHKTAAAAAKAPGSPRNGWVKMGVIEIEIKTPEDYVTTPPHIDGDPAPEVPARGAEVRTVASYTGIYAGRTGKVDGIALGDDGNTYVDVDFGGFTWPFLASELEAVEDAAEEVTAEDIEFAREVTRAMFATPAPEAPAKPAAPGYRRGTAVEYRAPGQSTWRSAVVESVRVSDNAVMVRRPNGTADAAPARDVRLAPAEAATYLARRR